VRSDDVIADRYQLVEVVGAGGTGIVWLAEDLRDNRKVALKRPLTTGARVCADLEREAENARKVVHPNVVKVIGVVGGDDGCWLVTAYFRATSLAVRGILPARAVAAIGAQVADALAAAHAVDVVHGNVAPGNVQVADTGTAKVTDFGISATVSGIAAYVSPEVADGGTATAASDVFSLGATLFAAVEGEPPFGTGDPDDCLRRIRSGRAEIPVRAGALRPVLDALLQRDPAGRPTAAQAKEMLERVAAGQTVPSWPGVKRRPRALPAAVAALAVVALLLLAVIRPWEGETGGPAHIVLGNPRTADPCVVADAAVLSRFGATTLAADNGGFNRCDVLIDVAGDDRIDVEFVFEAAAGGAGSTSRIVRHAPERDSDGCDIALTLADRSVLLVTAKSDDDVDTDFCQVADVAADHAEGVLGQYPMWPRRPSFDRRSLANLKACDLISAGDLATVPAYAAATPEPGFGDWSCRWQSRDGAVRVQFDRADTVREEGTRQELGGREVQVVPEGYGEFTCSADIQHLRYQDSNGDTHVELAVVIVEGGAAMADLCTVAEEFAIPVAARLPIMAS
jgi:hypothetical protein